MTLSSTATARVAYRKSGSNASNQGAPRIRPAAVPVGAASLSQAAKVRPPPARRPSSLAQVGSTTPGGTASKDRPHVEPQQLEAAARFSSFGASPVSIGGAAAAAAAAAATGEQEKGSLGPAWPAARLQESEDFHALLQEYRFLGSPAPRGRADLELPMERVCSWSSEVATSVAEEEPPVSAVTTDRSVDLSAHAEEEASVGAAPAGHLEVMKPVAPSDKTAGGFKRRRMVGSVTTPAPFSFITEMRRSRKAEQRLPSVDDAGGGRGHAEAETAAQSLDESASDAASAASTWYSSASGSAFYAGSAGSAFRRQLELASPGSSSSSPRSSLPSSPSHGHGNSTEQAGVGAQTLGTSSSLSHLSEPGSSTRRGTAEQRRSATILRGQKTHQVMRMTAAGDGHDERRVSFLPDGSGVEVKLFNVEERSPYTTRGPRRIFGGEILGWQGVGGPGRPAERRPSNLHARPGIQDLALAAVGRPAPVARARS